MDLIPVFYRSVPVSFELPIQPVQWNALAVFIPSDEIPKDYFTGVRPEMRYLTSHSIGCSGPHLLSGSREVQGQGMRRF